METKEILNKVNDAMELIKIARTMLVGIDYIVIDETKEHLEKAYKNLLSEWATLRTELDKEQREPS